MARTPSTMLPLGTVAPHFQLQDPVANKLVSLKDVTGERGTLVMFICNHCPYVIHVMDQFKGLADDFAGEGIGMVAINSNDVENYPQDAPPKMKELVAEQGWNFPFLHDEDQSVAIAYRAACTPDFYLFDGDLKLVYRGQLDGSRPGNDVPVTGEDLRDALQRVLSGNEPSDVQRPSLGCNIKWKAGNEPDYFSR